MKSTCRMRVLGSLLVLCGALSAQTTLNIVNTSFPSGRVGVSYPAQALQATGGTQPYSWSSTGSLPPGLGVNPIGVLSGTPTAVGTFVFSLVVIDARQASASKSFTVVVSGSGVALAVSTAALPPGMVGVPYSQTLAATGGSPPYTWAVGQGLPSSLNLNSGTGVISGTPTLAGNSSFSVQVTDSAGNTATGTVTLTINPSPLTIITIAPIFNGTVGV